MEETILNDIGRIKESLATSSFAEGLQKELVAKYRAYIPDIEQDLDSGFVDFTWSGKNGEPDFRSNFINLKAKLEMLLVKIKDENSRSKEKSSPLVHVTNTNSSDNHSTNSSDNNNTLSNTNNNTVDVKVLFEDARNKIEDDTSLGEEELQEILGKINELEELHDSDERPRSKWNKSKEVMTWVLTKGAKVASIVLPLITEVIKQ